MRFKKIIPLIFLICLNITLAWEDSAIAIMVEQTVEELTNRSDSILVGKVTDIRSEWNEDRTVIYTYITLSVREFIKGESKEETITIRQLGGEVDGVGMTTSESVRYRNDEELLVFLESDKVVNVNRVVGLRQGKYTIEEERVTGEKMAIVGDRVFATVEGEVVTRPKEVIKLEDFIGQIRRAMEAETE